MPLDIDIKQSEYSVSVRFSKVTELIASIHMLAHKSHHSFDAKWVKQVTENLSPRAKSLLDKLTELNFPGLELFDFVTLERVYDDIPAFIERLEQYSSIDFLDLVLDKKFSREQLMQAQKDVSLISTFEEEIPWVLKGSESFLRYIFGSTGEYKADIIELLKAINDSGFEDKLEELQERYASSIEITKQRLKDRNPVDVAEEIKGSKFSSKASFHEYIFCPSYFFDSHNIISYNEDTFLMIYNININNSFDDGEAERLSELLKVLSDKSRLEILRQLRTRPTYGKILATRLNLTTATISRHLDQLKAINLIREEKSNNVKYYYVNKDEFEKLLDEIRKFVNRR